MTQLKSCLSLIATAAVSLASLAPPAQADTPKRRHPMQVSVQAYDAYQEFSPEVRQQIAEELAQNGRTIDDLKAVQLRVEDGEVVVDTLDSLLLESDYAIYLGLRVGAPYFLGFDFDYVSKTAGVARFHVGVEAASSLFINTVNVGGGYHPGPHGRFYVGGRVYKFMYVDLFEGSTDDLARASIGPEIGWMGARARVTMGFRVGAILGFADDMPIMPNAALSVRVRLNN